MFGPTSIETGQRRIEFLRTMRDRLPPVPAGHRQAVGRPDQSDPFGDGRSIIGLDDVYDRLKRELPPDVELTLHFPRGGSGLNDQASTFARASVLVIPHGAATANFAFLPLDAVVLDVHALDKKFDHDSGIIHSLPTNPYNLTIRSINCADKTEPHATLWTQIPQWDRLTDSEKLEMLSPAVVNEDLVHRLKQLLKWSVIDWLDYRAYHPDPEELTEEVKAAVELWREKVKRRTSRQSSTKGRLL